MPLILITGGAGFIGANLAQALLESGSRVRILDDLSEGRETYLAGLTEQVEFIRQSITSSRAVRGAVVGADAIVHLAARSGVLPSVQQPERDFEVNVRGTFNVIDAARNEGVSQVVFASSGAVLAGAEPPLNERMLPKPLAPYGASKLYGEMALQAFASTFGLVGTALRFSNVYGPLSSHKSSVISVFLQNALKGDAFRIDGDGRQTRDFVYVGDITRAIVRALELRRSGTFHLATGVETNILEVARSVAEVANRPFEIEHLPRRPSDAERSFADVSEARSKLDWRAEVDLRTGVEKTWRWLAGAVESREPSGA